jgi:outer membrane protein OmpA-like peptidoglycan-associated protein
MTSRWMWVPLIAMIGVMGCASTAILHERDPLLVSAAPPPPPPPPPEPERVEVKKEKIQVNEKIHFEFDSAKIREESHNLVDEIAQVINDHPEIVKLRVEGHTDTQGSREYNKDLSKRRAQAVVKYLVDVGGVDEGRLELEGYGFDQPVASNDTEEGMAKNRRVEFTILERDESKAAAPAKPEDTAGGDEAEDDDDEAEAEGGNQ